MMRKTKFEQKLDDRMVELQDKIDFINKNCNTLNEAIPHLKRLKELNVEDLIIGIMAENLPNVKSRYDLSLEILGWYSKHASTLQGRLKAKLITNNPPPFSEGSNLTEEKTKTSDKNKAKKAKSKKAKAKKAEINTTDHTESAEVQHELLSPTELTAAPELIVHSITVPKQAEPITQSAPPAPVDEVKKDKKKTQSLAQFAIKGAPLPLFQETITRLHIHRLNYGYHPKQGENRSILFHRASATATPAVNATKQKSELPPYVTPSLNRSTPNES